MAHAIRAVLICLALCGCASSNVFSSLSTLGGGDGETAKPAAKSEPAPPPARPGSGSGFSGIWNNFSSAFSSGAQPVAQQPGDKPYIQTLDMAEALRLINDYRAAKGLSPLSVDLQATAAAEVLVKDMAQHDHMSHIGPGGQDVGKRLLAAGYSYGLAAENVGVGQNSIGETFEGWKHSPANSRNMLLPSAKHIGVAYEYKPDTQHKTFWALVIAAP